MACFRTQVEWMDSTITTLADIVRPGLKILFVGINPSPISVDAGHYHQGRLGRQFWSLLEESGILPKLPAGTHCDEVLLDCGCGITDLVKRPSPRADEITEADTRFGAERLRRLILQVNPSIVCPVYKSALGPLLGDGYARGRWGYLEGVRLGESRVFILPFPYRSAEEVGVVMPLLTRLIRQGGQLEGLSGAQTVLGNTVRIEGGRNGGGDAVS